MVLNYRNVDNFGVAVASSSKHERPSVKTAYIRLRIDIFEEFTIDYNLTAYTGCIKKTEQIWNRFQRREVAQSVKFLINIDCLGTYDVQ